jgi:protein SCO1/2
MPKSALARSVLLICLVLVATLLGVVGYRLVERGQDGSGGIAAIGGPFSLVDQNGARRTEADFRGRLMIVFFGYTHCPDICPTGLQTITDALGALGPQDAAKVAPLFITVDPARDTVERLKEYAGYFHPQLVALTGSEAEIAAAAKAYRVPYARAEASDAAGPGEYLMNHSAYFYLMDAQGAYLTHFTPEDSAEKIAETLRAHL